jgi:D-alanine-D-alanine ligase
MSAAVSTQAASAKAPVAGPASLRVAVLAGGRSAEHEISLSSGESIREGLLAGGHRVHSIAISKDGRWLFEGEPLTLSPGGGLMGVDVVFPALHGPFGEDGTVQGALEVLDVAYVGAGVAASAICMNKLVFKQLMTAAGTPQVGYVGISERRFSQQRTRVLDALAPLGQPLFVKPARMGSSLGIVKVTDAAAIAAALEEAFRHDELVLVEAMASGIEAECAVLGGDSHDAAAFASEPGQVSFASEWYDFDTKYKPGGIQLQVPAAISDAAKQRVCALALEVFARVECEDLARVDFFVDREQVLVNELNTMPGFTPTSVYAKLMEHAGVAYSELVDRLCRLALARHRQRQARSR